MFLCVDESGVVSKHVRDESPGYTSPAGLRQGGGDAVIDWTNKGSVADPSDNFDAFGPNEALARTIMQRALDDWMRVIVDFNYFSGGNTYNINISAGGTGGALGTNSVTGIEIASGKVTSSKIVMSSSVDWYFDSVPGTPTVPDDADFPSVVNAFAGSNFSGATDFYTVAMHEIGHGMGISVAPGSALAIQNYLTSTSVVDPNHPFAFLSNYNFGGGPIEATFTSFGGGHPLESNAPPGMLDHPNDLMNAEVPQQRRRLISSLDAEILRDAYGMTINHPDEVNNMSANLDTTSGNLTLRSDPTVPGDFFRVFTSGGTLVVDVNNFRESFPVAIVDSIIINADGAGSQFDIQKLPGTIAMTINAGDRDDSLFIGDGDYDSNILGDVVFFGGDGVDSIYIDDVADAIGSDSYFFGLGDFQKILGATLSFNSTERITLEGGTADDEFEFGYIDTPLNITVDGNGGNDTFSFGGDIDGAIHGRLTITGGAGTGDHLNFNDGLDVGDDTYSVGPTSLYKPSMTNFAITYDLTFESLMLRANADDSLIRIDATPTGRSTTVDGAGGNDTIEAGGDFDTDFDGYVSAIGGAGDDSLRLDDSADTGNDAYTLYASIGQLTKPNWAQEIDFAAFEQVRLLASDGNNTINVPAVGPGISVSVFGSGGSDLLRNGDGASFLDLDNWQGPLLLDGGAGVDTLQVDDSADFGGGARTYTFTASLIDRSGSADAASYADTEFVSFLAANSNDQITVHSTPDARVTIAAGGGNDAVHVNGVSNVLEMSVVGGDGDDTIDIGGGTFSDSISSDNVTLHGDVGTDRVIFRDEFGVASGNEYTLQLNSFRRNLIETSFQTFESVQIDGSPRISTYNLEFANIPATVTGGNSSDTMNVAVGDLDAFSAGITLFGGGGPNDSVYFDDTTDTGADSYNLSTSALTKGVGEGAFEGANYSEFESVRLDANNAANDIDVFSAVPGTRINAGGGADFIEIGTSIATVNVIVDGGAGLDDVRLNTDNFGLTSATFEVSQDLGNLQIGTTSVVTLSPGSDKLIRTNNFVITGTGALDLADNAMIYDYQVFNPINAIQGMVGGGYNNGAWNGGGIRSSTAAATANRAIGYADAPDIGSPAMFLAQPIDATTILIRYTIPGDANLDRVVNISDFSLMAANFNTNNRWSRGDFNYSGFVNIADFSLLAANFNVALPGDAPRPTASVAAQVFHSDDWLEAKSLSAHHLTELT